jgi:hypothetical protein
MGAAKTASFQPTTTRALSPRRQSLSLSLSHHYITVIIRKTPPPINPCKHLSYSEMLHKVPQCCTFSISHRCQLPKPPLKRSSSYNTDTYATQPANPPRTPQPARGTFFQTPPAPIPPSRFHVFTSSRFNSRHPLFHLPLTDLQPYPRQPLTETPLCQIVPNRAFLKSPPKTPNSPQTHLPARSPIAYLQAIHYLLSAYPPPRWIATL